MIVELCNRWFGWRYVYLESSVNTHFLRAHKRDCGWVAHLYGDKKNPAILLPDGKCDGVGYACRWWPALGWDDLTNKAI